MTDKMKYRTIFERTALLAVAAGMWTGCSERGLDEEPGSGENSPVEISPTVGRAPAADIVYDGPVDDSREMTLYFMRADDVEASRRGGYEVTYDTRLFCSGVRTAGDGEQAIAFTPRQFYQIANDAYTDGPANSLMRAYYPKEDDVTDYPSLVWNITGKEDVMVSNYLVGNCVDKGLNGNFALEHMLTQFQFYVYAETATTAAQWGKLTEIQVMNVSTQIEFDPANNDSDGDDLVECCYFDGNGNLSAYGIPSGGSAITAGTEQDDGSVLGAAYAGSVMMEPVDRNAVSLRLTTTLPDGTTTTIEDGVDDHELVIPRGTYEAGHSYNVYLKFNPREIEITLTAAPWREVTVEEMLGESDDAESYPYVAGGRYIVSRDLRGSDESATFHEKWDTTPAHTDYTISRSVAPAFEVAREDVGTMAWADAADACVSLGDGWRVPTYGELTLISWAQYSGLNDNVNFGGTTRLDESVWLRLTDYWSASEIDEIGGSKVLGVYFPVNGNAGLHREYEKTEAHGVRCVRDM